MIDVGHHVFGVTAPGVDEAEDLVVNRKPGDVGAHLGHHAGQVASLA